MAINLINVWLPTFLEYTEIIWTQNQFTWVLVLGKKLNLSAYDDVYLNCKIWLQKHNNFVDLVAVN